MYDSYLDGPNKVFGYLLAKPKFEKINLFLRNVSYRWTIAMCYYLINTNFSLYIIFSFIYHMDNVINKYRIKTNILGNKFF